MSQDMGFRDCDDSRGLEGRRLSGGKGDDREVNEGASAQRGSMFQDACDLSIHGGNMVTAGGHYINVTFNQGAMAVQSTITGNRETPSEHEQLRTSSQQPPSQSACEVYYRNLAVKKRGSPLWVPEPSNSLSLQYRKRGVSIGDVGLLSPSGNFDFFFNICLPQDHPINDGGVPDGFKPLTPPVPERCYRRMRFFKPDSYLASESIQIHHHSQASSCHGLIFESSAAEGAVLTMPRGAYSQDLITTLQFRKYMTEHIESWYRYLNQTLGCEAQNGDVRLVIGCDKTDAWGMAAHVRSTFQEAVRLTFQPAGDSQAYKWEFSGCVETRTGPDADEVAELQEDSDAVEIRNQCLFIRTLNANLQDDIWERLCAEIYSDMPVQGSAGTYIQSPSISLNPQSSISVQNEPVMSSERSTGRGSMRTDIVLATAPRYLSNVSPTAMMAHPSNAINDLLLKSFCQKFPTAKMVITEDNDWISVIKSDDSILHHPGELFSRIEESDIIDRVSMEEDVLFISPIAYSDKPTKPISIVSTSKLVDELDDSDKGVHQKLPDAIQRLSVHDDVINEFISTGGIGKVIAKFPDSKEGVRDASFHYITTLCDHDDIRTAFISAHGIWKLIENLRNPDTFMLWQTLYCTEALCVYDDIRAEFILTGGVHELIKKVQDSHSFVKGEALDSLTAFCDHEDIRAAFIANDGIQKVFDKCLDSNQLVRQAALKCIKMLLAHDDIRTLLISIDGIQKIIEQHQDSKGHIWQASVGCIKMLFVNDDIRKAFISTDGVQKLIGKLDRSPFVSQTLDCIKILCVHDDIRTVFNSLGGIQKVMDKLDDSGRVVQLAVLHFIKNVCVHDDTKAVFIENDGLQKISVKCQDSDEFVRKVASACLMTVGVDSDFKLLSIPKPS